MHRRTTDHDPARAIATERTLARVCPEAGAIVRVNVKLRDMSVTVSAHDEREVEVLASGLLLHHGAQLAVDVTLRSAVTAAGRALSERCESGTARLQDAARRDKELKYSELVDGQRCHLVVVALERGGRWSSEAHNFFERLAWAWSRDTHHVLQRSAFLEGGAGLGCCPSRAVGRLLGLWCRRAAICRVLTEWSLTWRTSFRKCEVVGVKESFTSNFLELISLRCQFCVLSKKKKHEQVTEDEKCMFSRKRR